MNGKLIAAVAAAAALTTAGSAFAQSSALTGGYVSLGAGIAHANKGCGAIDITGASASCDRSDTSIKLVGGYKVPGTDFAGELSYVDLGKFSALASGSGATAKDSYVGIGAAYLPELGNGWGGAARIGEAYGIGKVSYDLADVGGSQTKHDWHPYYGLGVNYALSRNVKLEADWDITRLTSQLPTYASSTATVNNYTLGVTYGF